MCWATWSTTSPAALWNVVVDMPWASSRKYWPQHENVEAREPLDIWRSTPSAYTPRPLASLSVSGGAARTGATHSWSVSVDLSWVITDDSTEGVVMRN